MIEAIARVLRQGGSASQVLQGVARDARTAIESLRNVGVAADDLGRRAAVAPPAPAPAPVAPPPAPVAPAPVPQAAVAPARRFEGLGQEELIARQRKVEHEAAVMEAGIQAAVKQGFKEDVLRRASIPRQMDRDLADLSAEVELRKAQQPPTPEGAPATEEERRDRRVGRRIAVPEAIAKLDDIEITPAWHRQTQVVKEQSSAIETLERRLEDLRKQKERGRLVDEDEIRNTRERLGQLRGARQQTLDTARDLEHEARNRGMGAPGGGGGGGGGGGTGALAAAVLNQSGMGGGGASIGLSLMRGLISGPMAAALGVGLALNYARQTAQQVFQTRVQALQQAIPLEMMGGGPVTRGGTDPWMAEAKGASTEFGMYDPIGNLALMRQLRRGGVDPRQLSESVLPTAMMTGDEPGAVAQRTAAFARLSARQNPYMNAAMLMEYSRFSKDRSLAPAFQTGVLQLASQTGPLVKGQPEGFGAQLAAMASMPIPGVEAGGPAALDIGIARSQTLNQFVGGMGKGGGPLGDISYFAVNQLRNNPAVVAKLKAQGIDISTPLGVMRAAARAPELAGKGIPEVGDTIMQRFQEFYPQQSMREMAAYQATGDTEAAAFLAGGDLQGFYSRTQAPPKATAKLVAGEMRTAAGATARGTEVEELFEGAGIRKQVQELDFTVGQAVGRAITEVGNDLRGVIYQGLEELKSSANQAPHTLGDRIEGTLDRHYERVVGGGAGGSNYGQSIP